MRNHQIALVTLGDPELPVYHTRLLSVVDKEQIYEVLPR
jgi:hypothetical protein